MLITPITSPSFTLSPTFTANDTSCPESGAGTSMVALSLSKTNKLSSASMLSPILALSSITSTSPAPPKSGTFISTFIGSLLLAPAVGASMTLDVSGLTTLSSGSSFEDSSVDSEACSEFDSNVTTNVPDDTLSPTDTSISAILPAMGAGTSMVALSLSKTMISCSASMVSPTFILISITSTSSMPPRSGTVTCVWLMAIT